MKFLVMDFKTMGWGVSYEHQRTDGINSRALEYAMRPKMRSRGQREVGGRSC